ncbi:triphosphoribosyl-dephospho-CoA synthase CitG [Citrobacter amalonaticus]|uniref:Probable 2-(5''-triphosphoribosyl)-3'-dephosphocoenzyme-A synthase n=1 Tax=Citrobacter amalonaticus TaxID=35703 RepID=A0A2S4RR29_CITAM|nr:triphosphoribosyl-dephospho-CoA synthase CitG [Citrobacter amalonaticus]POT54615.1 triphosphoribosyl-dephospho-CoA synthase CitG [Citrobacter amalonaticus]POT69561.1 triphosphoribosyl-dephospho-CoA synthase CitG [Citrobacter amalonaticus]POU60372.1 triphosphoribosyl-dephospho-CoA synthase CitG [Citrobacter amalonaticus]POV02667.1 triphosphoribosyl-dephospho-CoA synthase CitG [Citrobacter amalonaticus]
MLVALNNPALSAFCSHYAHLGWLAMMTEVNLTPKPGLVDRRNNGAHRDMTLMDFHRSASAIARWLPKFILYGAQTAGMTEAHILPGLRSLGLACEREMYLATEGINTHKGTIFSLGLLCAALGRHYQLHHPQQPEALCETVAKICRGLVARELHILSPEQAKTAGQRLWLNMGLSGARGEAESGFALVCNLALPHYRQCQKEGLPPSLALLNTLLVLIAHNKDTNVASRGGLSGLNWIQHTARELLARVPTSHREHLAAIRQFDDQCIKRHLSPGGSADLLIVTWFLSHLSHFQWSLSC